MTPVTLAPTTSGPGDVQVADHPKAAAGVPVGEGAFAARLARAQAEQQQPASSQDNSASSELAGAAEDAKFELDAETGPPPALPMLLLLAAIAPQALAIAAPAPELEPSLQSTLGTERPAIDPLRGDLSQRTQPDAASGPVLNAVSDAGAAAVPSTAFQPSPAAVTLPASVAASGAPATSVHVPAAVDTPAFAPALAQQVGLLVRDGQSLATLNLNPPELGPVSVQIVVEGKQARVDFVAELALTRGAIEGSLPSLAAALQEIGLTLSGGGVFDGRPRREAPEPPVQRGAGGDDPARAQSPSRVGVAARQAPRGLVDLVA